MARGGEGGVHDEELERPECMIAFFRLISLSLSLLLPPRSLPALRLEIPPNNPKPTHTHILTHWPTEPFSSPKDFHVVFLSGCNALRHECRHYGWCSALSIIFLSRRSAAALKASNKIKLCQGHKRLCPVNIAFTVSWMKECAHCGHKFNTEFFFKICLTCTKSPGVLFLYHPRPAEPLLPEWKALSSRLWQQSKSEKGENAKCRGSKRVFLNAWTSLLFTAGVPPGGARWSQRLGKCRKKLSWKINSNYLSYLF